MELMTETAAPTTPAERYALFRERRALAAVQPHGPLALINTQWVGDEQTIWGVPGRWAPLRGGGPPPFDIHQVPDLPDTSHLPHDKVGPSKLPSLQCEGPLPPQSS